MSQTVDIVSMYPFVTPGEPGSIWFRSGNGDFYRFCQACSLPRWPGENPCRSCGHTDLTIFAVEDDFDHYLLWFFYAAYLQEPLHKVDGIDGPCSVRSMRFETWLEHVDMYGLSVRDFLDPMP